MSTLAFRSTAPAGVATLVTACLAVSACILFIDFPALEISWAFLALTLLLLFCVWTPLWTPRLTWTRIDQLVWAILIGHTVQFFPEQLPRVLSSGIGMTTFIIYQMIIWTLCLSYSGLRLLATSARLAGLIGPSGKYVTLLLIAATASSLYAVSAMITLAWSLKLLTIVLTACLLFDARDPHGSAVRFREATFLGLVLLLLLFAVSATILPEMASEISNVNKVWRLGGTLLAATKLSAVAGLLALLTLVEMLASRATNATKLLFLLTSALMLASLGRGGMLATGVSFVVVLMLFRRVRLAVVLSGVVCLVFLVVPGAVDASWEMLSRRQGLGELASLTGRVPLWQTTVSLISEKPILGWGYVAGSRISLVTNFKAWPATDAHNAFLQMLLTLGCVGLFLLAAILSKIFMRLWPILRQEWSPSSPSARGLLAVQFLALAVFLLVQGMLEGGVSSSPNFETAILVGCVFAVDALHRPS